MWYNFFNILGDYILKRILQPQTARLAFWQRRIRRERKRLTIIIMTHEKPFAETDEQITVQLKYSGEAYDPNETENPLSLQLARNAANAIIHSVIAENELKNLATAILKQ